MAALVAVLRPGLKLHCGLASNADIGVVRLWVAGDALLTVTALLVLPSGSV